MVSHKGTACFNSGSFDEGLLIGSMYIVPAVKELTSHATEGDEDIVETVQAHWCNCLDQGTVNEGNWQLYAISYKSGYFREHNYYISLNFNLKKIFFY